MPRPDPKVGSATPLPLAKRLHIKGEVTVPAGVLVQAYGALGAVAHHLRNLPATSEFDDRRLADLAQAAYDAITEATIPEEEATDATS